MDNTKDPADRGQQESGEDGAAANADAGDNDACLQLALEGEKLCKAGNCRDGVAFFEAALGAGTDDFRTLSAIYSQLGNAYFYMGDYVRAMQYHKHDLTLARTMGDRLGEAKASGNLGNTLKVMGKFEEAVICCRRHLEICQEHGDRVGQGRALYNLGNVYHAKGKHIGRLGHQDPGEFPEEVRSLFEKAVQYYEENMALMAEVGDRAAQGRACGNLGNVHYLLGNFSRAVHFHRERLGIAREFEDRAAERRAHSNLGNAHIFLGEFERAAEHYQQTLCLARELGDRAVEAQACYSLGNTYTLLKDYTAAIDYHLRHLRIAQELCDRVGEGRACWSLGNAHAALGQHREAYGYAAKHLEISKHTGDRMGQATAQLNLAELSRSLGYPTTSSHEVDSNAAAPPVETGGVPGGGDASSSRGGARRRSMERMDILKMTPDVKGGSSSGSNLGQPVRPGGGGGGDLNNKSGLLDEEDFFDFISRFQSKRMDDQRCSLALPPLGRRPSGSSGSDARGPPTAARGNGNLVEGQQQPVAAKGGRVQTGQSSGTAAATAPAAPRDQGPPYPPRTVAGKDNNGTTAAAAPHPQHPSRPPPPAAAVPYLPGLSKAAKQKPEILQRLSVATNNDENFPDESFFEMLMKCQGSRIEEQRSSLPDDASGEGFMVMQGHRSSANLQGHHRGGVGNLYQPHHQLQQPPHAPTVPDEDFFSLIQRLQSGRLEDQRAALPSEKLHQAKPPAGQ